MNGFWYAIGVLSLAAATAVSAAKPPPLKEILGAKVSQLEKQLGKPILDEAVTATVSLSEPPSRIKTFRVGGLFLSVQHLEKNGRVYQLEVFRSGPLDLDEVSRTFRFSYSKAAPGNNEFLDERGKRVPLRFLQGVRGIPADTTLSWLKGGTIQGNFGCMRSWRRYARLP